MPIISPRLSLTLSLLKWLSLTSHATLSSTPLKLSACMQTRRAYHPIAHISRPSPLLPRRAGAGHCSHRSPPGLHACSRLRSRGHRVAGAAPRAAVEAAAAIPVRLLSCIMLRRSFRRRPFAFPRDCRRRCPTGWQASARGQHGLGGLLSGGQAFEQAEDEAREGDRRPPWLWATS